jgi:soluble lytic murein transglycosylase-like protein
MQLMPSTASYVGGELSLSGAKRDNLYDPKLNVGLSLKYIRQLLDSKVVENDLFRLATAYNAGPGNLNQWDSMIDYRDDALLFIESLPAQETRTFIEHVLANLWIYRHQLNQPTPTLDAIAAGGWPLYVELDGPVQTAQKHVPD